MNNYIVRFLLLSLSLCTATAVKAETLQGHIQSESFREQPSSVPDGNSETRIQRKRRDLPSTTPIYNSPDADHSDTRIDRKQNLLPNNDFKAEDFMSPKKDSFDLEAESGSRELMLAWELWHKQLCREIYMEAGRNARKAFAGSGGCRFRYTVTSDNKMSAELTKQWGDPRCTEAVFQAISHMNGNPGLTFPQGSRRTVMTDERMMLWAPNITPGYDWRHGDVEKVIENW